MMRFLIGVSALALTLPSLVSAQDDHRPEERSRPPAERAPHPEAARPAPAPAARPPQGGGYHQGPGAAPAPAAPRPPQGGGFHGGPGGPGGGHNFVYLGHPHPRFHGPEYRYPPGFSYRRWSIGERLPLLFLAPGYFFSDYAALGLDPPPYGYEWVRYGPDLLLVQLGTGQVVEVVPGAIY
jgi:Ni/Co efflux regulator RcnB